MAKKFAVTIKRTVTTVIEVEATTANEARAWVENYGVVEAAVDMATDDTMTARIQSVRKSVTPDAGEPAENDGEYDDETEYRPLTGQAAIEAAWDHARDHRKNWVE